MILDQGLRLVCCLVGDSCLQMSACARVASFLCTERTRAFFAGVFLRLALVLCVVGLLFLVALGRMVGMSRLLCRAALVVLRIGCVGIGVLCALSHDADGLLVVVLTLEFSFQVVVGLADR